MDAVIRQVIRSSSVRRQRRARAPRARGTARANAHPSRLRRRWRRKMGAEETHRQMSRRTSNASVAKLASPARVQGFCRGGGAVPAAVPFRSRAANHDPFRCHADPRGNARHTIRRRCAKLSQQPSLDESRKAGVFSCLATLERGTAHATSASMKGRWSPRTMAARAFSR
jgi:hypothetical protein